MKLLFQAFSNLTSINVDFVKTLLNQGIIVHVLPEHYLAKVFLLIEKLHGYRAKLVPIDMLSKFIPKRAIMRLLNSYDVLHFTGWTRLAKEIIKYSTKPKIYTIGALTPKEFYQQIVDHIDVIVSTTKWTLEQELKKIGAFSGRIEVIYWGVNLNLFNNSIPKDFARKKLGLPFHKKVILWNDRMFWTKDFETFLEAVDIVSKEVKDALFYVKIRGIDKNYWSKYRRKVREFTEQGVIKLYVGWIMHRNVPLLYRAADIYVRTSIQETFGLAYVEALACGTPVIAARAASSPEVLGDAAVYFKPKDPYDLANKLTYLLTDDEARVKYAKLGMERAKQFDWNIIAKKYCKLYSSLMERR
ncbi:MAG: glycosyltransferase family 4 protein [Thermoproteales archaeon]|nr:glycosyltransferase family 4 protein [Thermoproteales archaeon]